MHVCPSIIDTPHPKDSRAGLSEVGCFLPYDCYLPGYLGASWPLVAVIFVILLRSEDLLSFLRRRKGRRPGRH